MSRSATDRVRGLLHRRVKVHIIDGRIITGELACIDKQGNLVLQHAVQSFADNSEERQMGMAIIPKQQRTSCLVEVMQHDRDVVMELLKQEQ